MLEIGAGTGSVTHALLERGVAPERLCAVELDPQLAAYLERQFPRVRVLCGDAAKLRDLLPAEMQGRVSVAVSSLPLRNMRKAVRQDIVEATLAALAPHGELIQFTYRLRCPVPQTSVRVTAERVERIWNNMPPATVWRFRKI